jgi:uracil-DNA glycosylase
MTRPDREVLARLLSGLRQIQDPDQRSQALTLFAARAGRLQQGELMVVGRAVNGGDISFKVADLTDELEAKLVDQLWTEAIPIGLDPLGWVGAAWGSKNDYNTRRSQFWRVIRNVSRSIVPNAEPTDWYSHIIWTNLYKVSPQETGNPSGHLLRNQFAACVDLLATEITFWNPRRILFLTGLTWARPFLEKLGCPVTLVKDSPIQATAARGLVPIIVAPHPQGKPEKALAAAIVARFQDPDATV